MAVNSGVAAPQVPKPNPSPVLTREAAVAYALEHNPQLAVVREQRGLAAAGVVLARVYSYNPILNSVVLGVNGPAESGVTNHVFNEHSVTLQLELFGQGKHRRAAADAAVTRTEWEIAAQELGTATSVVRAYDTVLYREQKLRILDETVRLSEQLVEIGRQLADAQKLNTADLIILGTERDAARAQRGQGRTALAVARAELRRLLGSLDDHFTVTGELDPPLPALDAQTLIPYALALRPDVHTRAAAIAEAEARLRLQVADRFGNPSVGPRVEYNETRDTFIGVTLTAPIPILNRKQGEIAQRRAELARAQADLRSTEVQVSQAVDAALARLAEARKWAAEYPTEVLPGLQKARENMERLFSQNQPGVDVLRVLGVQRTLLRAHDAYLDARFEVSQARADLAAAVGEPALAAGASLPAPAQCAPCISAPATPHGR
jgi:cobalt-zinc-cadmium efflux system outer membrane protein